MNRYAEFLDRNDCLLLLVDIQQLLLEPCVDAGVIRKHAGVLIDAAKLFNIPMLFSVHNGEKLGGFLPELIEKGAVATVHDKLEFSCLENRSIAEAISKTGRKTLIICGIEAHVCIFHTGAHALRLGYGVHVVADAVSSRSSLNRDAGLRRLEMAGAVISSTEMVIFELLNRAGTLEFKSALPLLKTL